MGCILKCRNQSLNYPRHFCGAMSRPTGFSPPREVRGHRAVIGMMKEVIIGGTKMEDLCQVVPN